MLPDVLCKFYFVRKILHAKKSHIQASHLGGGGGVTVVFDIREQIRIVVRCN